MKAVLGVDGGNSKTYALIADLDGCALGFARDGGSNHEQIGFAEAEVVLQRVTSESLTQAGVGSPVESGFWGLAGADVPSDFEALNAIVATQGVFPPRSRGADALDGSPKSEPYLGEITLFAGDFAPRDWEQANAQLLAISQNEALFSLFGTTYGGDGRTTFGLPDLRGRAAMHEGTGPGLSPRWLGSKIGTENVTLTAAQMPSHDHTLPPTTLRTGDTGGSQPHPNMQPSLTLNYIIALEGTFPPRSKTPGDPDGEDSLDKDCDPYIGEICLFGGNFAPCDWAFCDGQLLSISQYSALFAILGTAYGGDGRTTFALPDLRGRVPIHPGTGPGLDTYYRGQRIGAEEVALTVGQLPCHTHGVPEPATLSLLVCAAARILFKRRRSSSVAAAARARSSRG